ncbi:MAG: VCBS repeat-containing protein, partial [Myxococcales bacterium]|nr:VCBS repeat-containing protein [Polyangiaceae bacterium]MDW8249066.1 VCBS repeat-containing protein [Myxococcales bacterium]
MAVQVLTHLLLLLLASACTSNHRVSPFPPVGLTVFLCPADDLPGQLERATREAVASGLRETLRIKGTLPDGKPFVALGFSGIDPAGLPTHATRVVTPASVVLALGPAHVVLQELPRPDELLPALHPSGAYPSGVDLTGDQAPDVILRASDGTLAIYRIDLLGSTPYPIQLRAPPTWALDLDEDGRPDLAGLVPVPEDDAIHPELLDIAVADGTGFRNDHPAVLAHHRAMAERPMPPGS